MRLQVSRESRSYLHKQRCQYGASASQLLPGGLGFRGKAKDGPTAACDGRSVGPSGLMMTTNVNTSCHCQSTYPGWAEKWQGRQTQRLRRLQHCSESQPLCWRRTARCWCCLLQRWTARCPGECPCCWLHWSEHWRSWSQSACQNQSQMPGPRRLQCLELSPLALRVYTLAIWICSHFKHSSLLLLLNKIIHKSMQMNWISEYFPLNPTSQFWCTVWNKAVGWVAQPCRILAFNGELPKFHMGKIPLFTERFMKLGKELNLKTQLGHVPNDTSRTTPGWGWVSNIWDFWNLKAWTAFWLKARWVLTKLHF